jgi:HrpA-like RNA helicase
VDPSSIFPNVLENILQNRGTLGEFAALKNPELMELGAGLSATVVAARGPQERAQATRQVLSKVVRSGVVSSEKQRSDLLAKAEASGVIEGPASTIRALGELLPIFPFLERLRDTILRNDITVVDAPTSSGKSTLIPLLLVDMDIGEVVVTNPRRDPCELLGNFGGKETGFRHGVGHNIGPSAKAIYTTAAYEQKRQLAGRANSPMVVMLDEFHELTKETTLLLEVLMRRQRNGEHIKVVISSATINGDDLQQTLVKKYPELAVESVSVPVKRRFPVVDLGSKLLNELAPSVAFQTGALVFLPGHQEIVELQGRIKTLNPAAKVVVFSAELSESEKKASWRAMEQGNAIMLATDALKSSVTVPNLRHVHATPYVRAQQFGADGEKRLAYDKITGDTADQQVGRTGRVCPGDFALYGTQRESLLPRGVPQIATQPLLAELFDFAMYFESEAAIRRVPPVVYAADVLRSAVHKASDVQIRFAEYQLQTLDVISPQGYVTNFGRTLGEWTGDIRTRIILSRADEIIQELGLRPEAMLGEAIDAAVMLEVDGIFARHSPIHDLLGRGVVYDGWRDLDGIKIDSTSDVITQMRVFRRLIAGGIQGKDCAQWGVDARKMHDALVIREKLRNRCAEVLTKRARHSTDEREESTSRGANGDGRFTVKEEQSLEAATARLKECIVAAYIDTIAFFERGGAGSPRSSGYRPLASAGPGYMRNLANTSVVHSPRFVVGNWMTIDSSPDYDAPVRLITLGTKVDPAWLVQWVKGATTAPRDVITECSEALGKARRLAQQQRRRNRSEGAPEATTRRRPGDPGRNRR